jgi:hypothetical protein
MIRVDGTLEEERSTCCSIAAMAENNQHAMQPVIFDRCEFEFERANYAVGMESRSACSV